MESPRFAFCNELFVGQSLEQMCRSLAALGYTGLEIAPFTLKDNPLELIEDDAKEIAENIRTWGLEPIGLHWLLAQPEGMHLTVGDSAIRQQTADFVIHLTHICAAMGGKVMVWGSPGQRTFEPPDTWGTAAERAVEVWKQVSGAAEELGVTLALEPLGTVETNFMTTAEEGIDLIERVGSPACRLHLDVKAMSSESKPIDQIIRGTAPYVAHFHANDPNLRGPGLGEVDFQPIATALQEIEYDGWVSVEAFKCPDGPEEEARLSMECLQECFEAS
jgi:sugar phosphate isomerase/epimerase